MTEGYCPADDSVIPFVFRGGDDLLGQFSRPLSLGNFSIHFRLTPSAEREISCILSNFAPSPYLCLSPNVSPHPTHGCQMAVAGF